MKNSSAKNKLINVIKKLYATLFLINDTPHKIALGVGLGVFAGIMPGTGLIAALFLAFIARANRAAALLGSLMTNTWLSIVTFLLSIKVGSGIMGLDWESVYRDYLIFLKNFQWVKLFKIAIIKLVLPLILGYVVIAAALGLLVYLVTFITIKGIKYAHKS